MPRGDDPIFREPHPERDHVFRLGAGIEVHAAQDDQQAAADLERPGTGLLGKQVFRYQGIESALVPQVASRAFSRAIEVEPQKAVPRRPALDPGPIGFPPLAVR